MVNIHEILKAYGVEIPADKKGDFDKSVAENYKTIAEFEKTSDKLAKEISDHKDTKSALETITTDFEELKNNNATKEDWEKKYNELVAESKAKEEEKAKADIEARERSEFDNYFSESNKEWANPFIADGYFAKYKEAKDLDENKGKMLADILHTLTKDDATAFKTTQPEVILKGGTGGTGTGEAKIEIPAIF